MRRLLPVLVVVSILGACTGIDGGVSSTSAPDPTATTELPTGTTVPDDTSTTKPAGTTSTTASAAGWTVAGAGLPPTRPYGESRALGSGCSPGTEVLPDGVWFGWPVTVEDDTIAFDLACLWPGRVDAAASNDAARLRIVPVTADTVVRLVSGPVVGFDEWDVDTDPADLAPGLPEGRPVWLYVNDGVATEVGEHPDPVRWAFVAGAWPDVTPGCCDAGTVAPPSPSDPWPGQGWPVDGFYPTSVEERTSSGLVITIGRWLACADHPGLCPSWWTADEVTSVPGDEIARTLPLTAGTTVVVRPITGPPLVGDGAALADLLDDLDRALDEWGSEDLDDLGAMGDDDPDFPFGWSGDGAVGYPVGYRGPGGAVLTHLGSPPLRIGWPLLEIRDATPILHVDAGIIAG